MRRKLALLAATALVGATIAVGAASPALADHCDEIFNTDDPVIIFTCRVVDSAPEPGPTVDHYYYLVTGVVHQVYCVASPYC
jgi:hypothetical protein